MTKKEYFLKSVNGYKSLPVVSETENFVILHDDSESKKSIWKKVLTFVMRVIEVAIAVFFGVELTGIISS